MLGQGERGRVALHGAGTRGGLGHPDPRLGPLEPGLGQLQTGVGQGLPQGSLWTARETPPTLAMAKASDRESLSASAACPVGIV